MRARRDEGWAPPVRLRRWGIVVEPRTDAHSTSRLALWSLKEVEFDPGLSSPEVARAIEQAEQRVRARVPSARVIYLEPDCYRAGTPVEPVSAPDP
jgi:hypothetical protein